MRRLLLGVLCAGLGVAARAQTAAPVIDGVFGAGEWRDARHEALRGVGDLYFAVREGRLSLAIRGARAGLASLCIGDERRVTILHASAALGSARYEFADGRWQRRSQFEWKMRESPRTGGPSADERAAYLGTEGWLSNASAAGNPVREFAIVVKPEFKYLAVTFLGTDEPMTAATWPASAADDCTSAETAMGNLPDVATLRPETWHALQARVIPVASTDDRMKLFNRALGVECTFCHIESTWQDSAKPQWTIARGMWRMVQALNADQLGNTSGISCVTCHGGQSKPSRLPRESWEAIAAKWPASAAEEQKITMSVYSASLGVGCEHCHDPSDWKSTAKPPFATARRMIAMFDEFPKYMPATARTQCYMCHKGRVKPQA